MQLKKYTCDMANYKMMIVKDSVVCTNWNLTMLRILLLVFVVLPLTSSILHAREYVKREVTASSLDRQLYDAFHADRLNDFEGHLNAGADPTAFFDNTRQGWIYCAATEIGKEDYLQLIVDKGHDTNYLQDRISLSFATPLYCAIWHDNFYALEFLVNSGADVAMLPCTKCISRSPSSALSRSINLVRFNMAVWLFHRGEYSKEQFATVVFQLEKFALSRQAAENPDRLKLVELLREKGFEVTPWMHPDSKTENR